jgi:hypothetical protein
MPSISGAPILAIQDVEASFVDLHWSKYLISAVALAQQLNPATGSVFNERQ